MDIAPFVQLVTQLLSEEKNARQEAERALEDAKTNVPDQLVVALVLILQNESIGIQVSKIYHLFYISLSYRLGK